MDVDTAPLLVKRRGMKRHLEKDVPQKCISNNGRCGVLKSVSENSTFSRSDLTLDILSKNLLNEQEIGETIFATPLSAAFTEYRDNKPPYLKYSRDDFEKNEDCIEEVNKTHSNSLL